MKVNASNVNKPQGKTVLIIVVLIALFIVFSNSYTVIEPDERGVAVQLGEITSNEPIQPGFHWKTPFLTSIETFSIVPKTYEVTFSVGEDGAITKDMQTLGATVVVRYNYDENRIIEIVRKYRNSTIIENAMKDCIKASLKETTGKYSIYDLVSQQDAITAQVAEVVLRRMQENYPVLINSTTITNFDWSEDFDKQIRETANRTQQVKQAEQEANIAAAQAQKLVKEAEARKQAAELDAEAQIATARGAAEAKRLAADAQAYENQKIAQNLATMQAQWNYEINLQKAKNWNGKEVPDAAYIVPGTGAVVPLSGR
ncbi:MAG: hypothetical protein IJ150_06805 [Bacteroidales bacterium]|nr:hypothetical protein [Bacteroidales bacterium]